MAAEQHLGIEHIVSTLKKEGCTCWVRYNKLKLQEIGPWEFFSFAREDLKEDSERGRVNALSNAKRAIECRADELITLLNFRYFALKHPWGLRYKLEVLKTLAISAPDVLIQLITSKRNLLEHEYVRPRDVEQVKYVADIVELFLKASDSYIEDGHIASVEIRCPKEVQEERATRTKLIQVFDMDDYELKFSLEKHSLSITHRECHMTREISKSGGDIKERGIVKSETDTSFPISHCRQEDFRELINLIRERAR